MSEPARPDPLEPSTVELFARVRRSLVDVHVTRANGDGELHTLGVAMSPGVVKAWSGVVTAAATWESLESIPLRQGLQSWRAQLGSLRAEWALCSLEVHGACSVPIAPWRRSTTLAMGERLVYAVADPDGGEPKLAWTELTDVFTEDKQSYCRAWIWTVTLDPSMPRAYAFVFDREARVVGILEPMADYPAATLAPGEWVGRLEERCWVDLLLKQEAGPQLVDEYRAAPDSYEAEALCAVALALVALGDGEGAIQALRRAVAKDPRNPWPVRTLAGMLPPDRSEEAQALLARAVELEAQEPLDSDALVAELDQRDRERQSAGHARPSSDGGSGSKPG